VADSFTLVSLLSWAHSGAVLREEFAKNALTRTRPDRTSERHIYCYI